MKPFALILSLAIALCMVPAYAVYAEQTEQPDVQTEQPDGQIDLTDPDEYIFGKTQAFVEGTVYTYVKDLADGEYEYDEVTLYSVEGGDIPYISVTEYMSLLSEILEKAAKRSGITYDVDQVMENYYLVSRPDVETHIWIDTEYNTLKLENFNAFTQKAGVTASVSLIDLPDPISLEMHEMDALLEEMRKLPDDEQAGFLTQRLEQEQKPEALFATVSETINRIGDPIDLNLSDYLIDIVEQDEECYLPLQTMNDLFLGLLYVSMIFDGETLYCFQYGSKLPENIKPESPEEMSEDYTFFNYNELRFMLDCFYGLKKEHGISSFAALLGQNTGLSVDLVSSDPSIFDSAIARLTMTYFDDGHSAFLSPSWRSSDKPNLLNYIGVTGDYSDTMISQYKVARSKAFPDSMPMYQEVGDTAFVTFDVFEAKDNHSEYYHMDEPTAEEFVLSTRLDEMSLLLAGEIDEISGDSTGEAGSGETDDDDSSDDDLGDSSDDGSDEETQDTEEETPIDTIRFLYYAYKQITREDSPVKNVVLDLSINGGGESDAAVYTLVWMLGQANIVLRDTFTNAETIMRLTADLEFTEDYTTYKKGLVKRGYNVYCLISPNSFSCGNLVPAALRMSDQVTLIGRMSGGGSCVVLPCATASGTLFQISGPQQLSTIRNGSFYNIDQGIEPDVVLNRIETFYDREALVDIIHNLK